MLKTSVFYPWYHFISRTKSLLCASVGIESMPAAVTGGPVEILACASIRCSGAMFPSFQPAPFQLPALSVRWVTEVLFPSSLL